MLRVFRVLCLVAVVSTTAWADSAQTDRATAAEITAEHKVAQLTARRAQLTARYQDEIAAAW